MNLFFTGANWSKEDEAFIAEVPELPGCAPDGASYAEAVANVEVVIEVWIETAKKLGREIPEAKGRLENIRASQVQDLSLKAAS